MLAMTSTTACKSDIDHTPRFSVPGLAVKERIVKEFMIITPKKPINNMMMSKLSNKPNLGLDFTVE